MSDSLCFKTALGWIGLAATDKGVSQVVLGGQTRRAAERALLAARAAAPAPLSGRGRPLLLEAQTQILEYLAGTRRNFAVPVDLSSGTVFQRRVWRTILSVPYGRVRPYRWVAIRVGGSRYARAVGMALGANPVPLIVPCHRVVAHDGSLGGFSCGLPIKRRLLRLEGTLSLLGGR